MAQIHENQITCGDSIIKAFKEEEKQHVLLLAQMQMGKSGTYWYVILNMLFNKEIENVILMSGNRETELHQQVTEDKTSYRKWFLDESEVAGKVSVSKKNKLRNQFLKSIQILWGGQLNKKNKETFEIFDDTLIVWDEAHYAQSENNAPYHFFEDNNLQTLLNGTKSHLETNIRLLTVSATPFSELVSTSEEEGHKVIKLIPGVGYCGLDHYMRNELINSSFGIEEDTMSLFKQTLSKHSVSYDPKYMIVRVTDNKKKVDMIHKVCDDLNISYKHYNSTQMDIDLDEMAKKPLVSTVIIISGMLRMGKVIHKEHISMVFEASTKNEKRKVDTGLQGLLGRVCGYSKDPNGFEISVYVESSNIDEIKQYTSNYDTMNGPYCSNAMNTREGCPNTKKLYRYNVFELPLEKDFLTEKKNVCKPKVLEWLKTNYLSLEMDDSASEHFSELVFSDETTFVSKNLNMKSNKGLNILLEKDNHTSYRNIPAETCYLLNNDEQLWLVFNTNEHNEDNDEVLDNEVHESGIFVMNKCVFKK